jgi:hypothetical protein
MEHLNETVYVDQIPVGTVKGYIDLNEVQTAALLYQRLNRNRTVLNHVSLEECIEYAQEIRNDMLKEYLVDKTN